jgi:hypothetical protein
VSRLTTRLTAMIGYWRSAMPASMSANFEMNPDNGGIPARLSADTRNMAARNGVVRTIPPMRLRRLEPLAWSTRPPMRNSAVLATMWWTIE